MRTSGEEGVGGVVPPESEERALLRVPDTECMGVAGGEGSMAEVRSRAVARLRSLIDGRPAEEGGVIGSMVKSLQRSLGAVVMESREMQRFIWIHAR